MDEKRPPGRPRLYETPEAFDLAVDAYVADRTVNEKPITWTGMALALGFSSRTAIDKYLEYDGFYHSVKRAKLIVEAAYEERLGEGKPVGAIFALKNFGWRDRQEVGLTDGNGGDPFGSLADAIRSATKGATLRGGKADEE